MPRRILLLITDLEIGGTPTVVRELAVRLHRPPGAVVEVACLSTWGPVADQLKSAGIAVTALGCTRAAQFPIAVRGLVRLVRSRGFDTVFSFLIHANAVAAAAAVLLRGVRFFQSVQTTQPAPRWHWRLQGLVHNAAGRVVVPSLSAARAAREWAGVPDLKTVVIPNAIDVDSFDAIFRDRRVPEPPFHFGFIGRFDPVKRVPDLLEAAHGLATGHVHVDLFGDGPERANIEREIERLGLGEVVTLHGTVPRPHEALSQIDVLVLPSEAEGFGLVLIEAMAAGVPVVATDVPGIRDVVRDTETGVLVPPRTPAAIRGAATMLCLNHEGRRRLVVRARADVERRFAWGSVLPMYESLLGLPPTVQS